MDKNEELQKWLNDDRYVHLSKLATMWNLSNSGTLCFLRRRNIVSLKVFHCGHRGRYAFYDLKKCESAREAMHQEISYANDYENNQILVAPHELAILWGFTRSSAASFLNRRNIKPVKKFEFGGRRGTASFYNRAECERARPFINQPEQKEVEQVENIGELTTATKHQILIEACADDFVWDKVTMKNKIMPVKNYCDERGNFVSLFKKDETVSAILAYKNEQKQLLEKCLADKNLVTTKDLVKIWNLDKSAVYNKIYRLKIKPYAKIKLDNGSMWHFYKKADCIESQGVEKVEEKQMELPKPTEQTPDIIPADTIDLFTMSELESEFKNRGVELTAEVRAKINASDMPEMQHIATMLRGNAKTIAIRLSVLNEIAGQLKTCKMNKWEKSWFDLWQKVDAEIESEKTTQEIKEIKKVLARSGSPTSRDCKDILKKYDYIGVMEAGEILEMTYYTLQTYAQSFLPDIVATMGYSPSNGCENGKSTSFFWKREKVLARANERKQNKENEKTEQSEPKIYDNKFFDWHLTVVSNNLKQKLAKMAECDKISLSLKIEQIINAAWIMGNYEKK